jgi:hypothetical protein
LLLRLMLFYFYDFSRLDHEDVEEGGTFPPGLRQGRRFPLVIQEFDTAIASAALPAGHRTERFSTTR